MIHVTQGHEKGIGLEVFLKSLALLRSGHHFFKLYANYDSLQETIKTLNLDIQIEKDYLLITNNKIAFANVSKNNLPESTSCLLEALENIDNENDVLLTLPTSKDQLIHPENHKVLHGYTEFLRDWFNLKELTMCFLSPEHSVCLVTDHIPLKDVPKTINEKLIFQKVTNSISTLSSFRNISRIFIAGINPHSGEGGLLGTEDSCISLAVERLKKDYPHMEILGPIPGDTMHFHHSSKNDLLVYMYHDQGLAPFKFINKLIGINITCGLPFIRVSVDHGTSFNLYGKNSADPSGCYYLLQELIK